MSQAPIMANIGPCDPFMNLVMYAWETEVQCKNRSSGAAYSSTDSWFWCVKKANQIPRDSSKHIDQEKCEWTIASAHLRSECNKSPRTDSYMNESGVLHIPNNFSLWSRKSYEVCINHMSHYNSIPKYSIRALQLSVRQPSSFAASTCPWRVRLYNQKELS